MTPNIDFFKLNLTHSFLSECASLKQQLLDELIIYATDPIRRMRRMRMISQLCQYESQILQKIQNFSTDDVEDLQMSVIQQELKHVCDRSA
jgi:hypothetical protein